MQDNHSRSARNVLRGLHYQVQQPQGKLVRVISGAVFDVAVDLRRSSPTFGRWVGFELSAANKRIAWIPPASLMVSWQPAISPSFLYKTTDYWAPEHERSILWNDADLGIRWPLEVPPTLSTKDSDGMPFAKAEVYT